MTVDEWLDRREPRPPSPLKDRLKVAMGPSLSADAAGVAQVLLLVAEQKLTELASSSESGRSVAGDLLAIDALTTYALEAAAATPQSLAAFSTQAVTRLVAISPHPTPARRDIA